MAGRERIRNARVAVLGTGCAGLNAADCLWDMGCRDILMVTDSLEWGTSRNAGSDKQTYYKLSLAGDAPDSVGAMAADIARGGTDGELALCQAAYSAECFLKLCRLGVPFPRNDYGEYVGYRTDHDATCRATSAGPLTSRYMSDALRKSVTDKGIPLLEGVVARDILVVDGAVAGLLATDLVTGESVRVDCQCLVVCTGGAALVYGDSVFPVHQRGAMGLLLRAGAKCVNLHLWQYGLASVKFRWNLSGSYQQALPRYFSVDAAGLERDFLDEIDCDTCFRKGYEWPYDPAKAQSGSSRMDLLVLRETRLGRRVYMDFTRNPNFYRFDALGREAREYLINCGATGDTPIARLAAMNAPAVALYKAHGIDLTREPMEIRVCAQHQNGGAWVDANWQTSIRGLYAAGEAAGTFGAARPGGSALNAGQVGACRAARHIARTILAREPAFGARDVPPPRHARPTREEFDASCREMSDYAGIVRDRSRMISLAERLEGILKRVSAEEPDETSLAREDAMTTQWAMLMSMLAAEEAAPGQTIAAALADGGVRCAAEDTRPLPQRDLWFERVWRAHIARSVPEGDQGKPPPG